MICRALFAALFSAGIAGPLFADPLEQKRLYDSACDEARPTSAVVVAGGDAGPTAFYYGPTEIYPHGVLGDTVESSGFQTPVPWDTNFCDRVAAPQNTVFEDLSPRMADLNGDGLHEIITVNSHFELGARLAVFGYRREGAQQIELLAATPYIGTRFRWLAPVGVSDFNGDGDMDVAYVDRPHLAKTLRIWTYRNGSLTEIATLKGVTNHSIGEDFITSSIRTCNGRPEMVLNDANRKNIVSVFFKDGKLTSKTLGKFTGRKSVENPPAC